MNILLLTMVSGIANIETSGIYTDLMRKFRDNGHEVYIVYPKERRQKQPTGVAHLQGIHFLGVKTLNVTKTNVIEKGIGQVLMEGLFRSALKRHFGDINFDLILYSTPPITLTSVIKYAKERNPKAVSYLLLKDIFPQNAVDLGMLSKNRLIGLLYKYFRKKEKELYRISDYIGCMSPANVQYVLKHNPEINSSSVEIAPNSYEIPSQYVMRDVVAIEEIRKKYNLPICKPIFIYGGNMGKPQGIPFLIECMKAIKDREDCHFVIVGDGTEYFKLESFMREYQPKAVSLFRYLPKNDYDALASACDVGLIFLDYHFTIPNYPSRLLPYLMGHKPILAATDPNCDTGSLAEENGYGMWCPSNDVNAFTQVLNKLLKSDLKQMGENGYRYYLNNYTVQHTYDAIMSHLN